LQCKSIWFDKNNKNVVHCDIRVSREYVGLGKNGRWWDIRPDVRMNFIAMPFPCEFFEMVVFDPPHLKDIGIDVLHCKKNTENYLQIGEMKLKRV